MAISLDGGKMALCAFRTQVGTLAPRSDPDTGLEYVAALVNNDVCSLSYELRVNSRVSFLTIESPHGWRIYRQSLCYLLSMAVNELCPSARFSVEHSFGLGLYCSLQRTEECGVGADGVLVGNVEERMRGIVERDLPIERRSIAFMDAVKQFEEKGLIDRLNLLRFRNPPLVTMHCCGDYVDIAHGPLAPRTGTLRLFNLIPYEHGLVLHLPDRSNPTSVDEFDDQPHLFQIFKEHKEWGRILGVTTAGRLNEIVVNGESDEFVSTVEALHEKKLARIADEITAQKDNIRIVLIAGPSSAGKTTFSKRLTTQLRVNGITPVVVSADNYFREDGAAPPDENGVPDFEHIEALDLDLFNEHLKKIIAGEEVQIPYFNFARKKREYRGNAIRMERDQVLILEGIHALNPRLTSIVPRKGKFGIYVSALTQLNIDSSNRISTTDNRLMRRIVRDHSFRSHSALQTLRMWPSVRRGEKTWIFPFQKEANATFNSALDYELAVLKPLVEPLLMEVKPGNPEYAESRRLSEFLRNFVGMSPRAVPPNSILREYIGESFFKY